MDEQLYRVEVDPLLDIETIRWCSIADRERRFALPLRAVGHAESTSLDTPAERHKQARVKRGKNKDEEAPQRNGNRASSLDPHPIPPPKQ
jgi:hypothetical protein